MIVDDSMPTGIPARFSLQRDSITKFSTIVGLEITVILAVTDVYRFELVDPMFFLFLNFLQFRSDATMKTFTEFQS